MLWNFNFPVAKVVEVVVHSKKKRKHWKEREGWISFGGHLRTIFGCRGLYWGIKVVKSVKKDVKSRVESKGLYWGKKVVFFDFLLYCMRLKYVNLKDSVFRPLDVVNLVELLLASPRNYSIFISSLALIVWVVLLFLIDLQASNLS